MDETTKGIHAIYDNRERYIIIGLTGRTGSGCSTAASILEKSIKELKLVKPKELKHNANENRKYSIIKRFVQNNWSPFVWIKIKDIITSFILEVDKDKFAKYISKYIEQEKGGDSEKIMSDFLDKCGNEFDVLRNERLELKKRISDEEERHTRTKKFYFEDLPDFSDKIKSFFDGLPNKYYTKVYQKIGDNIRSSGNVVSAEFSAKNIFAISKRVNRLLKIFTNQSRHKGTKTYIVIDTLRNPFEALYFRERYSAFYLMAINTDDFTRKKRLQRQYDLRDSQIAIINKKESNKIKSEHSEFVSQNIQKCYDLADIHVSNPQIGTDDFSYLKWQLVKFIALIMHPGIIMPSSVERSMQIAHTAKLNSGCLSRQVGACITNESFSVKAVGWNTPPEGQTPCSLRNVYDLLSHKDDSSFSKFENNDSKFRKLVETVYKSETSIGNLKGLKGRNVSYCFKDIKNELDHEKNQVHTRSLHAEENAFLQIVKYGGQAIKGGKLFTTSSPCELCAKKSYQLGIVEIYYIDPYPGISSDHILNIGTRIPNLTMFSGAIGRAYHQLYEPIIPPKDEIKLILKTETKDFCKSLQDENKELKSEIEKLKAALEKSKRIRLDCVRHEPQSEPFVGQARP